MMPDIASHEGTDVAILPTWCVACARGDMIAVHTPPPDDSPSMSWLVKDDPQAGCPLIVFYPLTERCATH
jgi:hypothetical protein